jgi:hypothetical protein
MVLKGCKDCFNAIFNPEVLHDLRAYYSDRVLSYTVALVSSGYSGIQKLANAGQSGV